MIDFTFTPEIEAVRLKVRAFMDEQVRPQWDAIDQNDRAQVVKAIVELRKLAREDWNLWLPHMPADRGSRRSTSPLMHCPRAYLAQLACADGPALSTPFHSSSSIAPPPPSSAFVPPPPSSFAPIWAWQ